MRISALLAAARGEQPADLLLRNGRVVNVLSGEIEEADVALCGGRIAGVGAGYTAGETVDLQGAFIAPGLIDAHVHIESSLCLPAQFAAAVVPRGVTTAVIDPHEIANVAGVDGVRFMAESSRGLPVQVVLMAPSAVPATPMETNGAALSAEELAAVAGGRGSLRVGGTDELSRHGSWRPRRAGQDRCVQRTACRRPRADAEWAGPQRLRGRGRAAAITNARRWRRRRRSWRGASIY